MIIGVQNHGDFFKTADHLISLLNRVDSPWCGAIVDTGYFKAADPYAEIAKAASYAVNWQVKQSPLGVEKEAEVPTDLKRLVRIVRAAGYRGYLPIETLSPRGGDGPAYDPSASRRSPPFRSRPSRSRLSWRRTRGRRPPGRARASPALNWVNLRVPDGEDYVEFTLYDKYPSTDRLRTMHHICLEVPDAAQAGEILKGRRLQP